MKHILFTFLLISSLSSYCQKKFSAELLTGFGFNKNLSLIDQEVKDYTVFSTQINANYKIKLSNSFFAETGLGVQWYFSSGIIALSDFKSTNLRLSLPLIFSYTFLEKINIGVGGSIVNNRDFNDFNFKENYNLRMSLILKSSYMLKDDFSLLLIIKQNISNIPDLYLLHQPATDVLLGVSYNIF